jgi:hypothetical protein
MHKSALFVSKKEWVSVESDSLQQTDSCINIAVDFNGLHMNILYPSMPPINIKHTQQQNNTTVCEVYVLCLMALVTLIADPSRK